MIIRPVPMVSNALPNQIAGRFFPILEATNPEMMETLEDPSMKGSDLHVKNERARSSRAREIHT